MRELATWPLFMIKKCETCGEPFTVYPYQIKDGNGRFCKRECYGVWASKSKMGENNPSWRGGWINVKCLFCEDVFLAPPSSIKRRKSVFCDRECKAEWMSKNLRGNKSYAWKGGVDSDIEALRHSKGYLVWRGAVLLRDKYFCKKCGGRRHLNAHHLISFKSILQEIREKFPLLSLRDIGENYPILWNVSNGVTLCKSCHIKKHSNDQTI